MPSISVVVVLTWTHPFVSLIHPHALKRVRFTAGRTRLRKGGLERQPGGAAGRHALRGAAVVDKSNACVCSLMWAREHSEDTQEPFLVRRGGG